jgi:hypothetical protein
MQGIAQPEERMMWQRVHERLLMQGRRSEAASFVSASQRGTGRWLCAKGGWDYRVHIEAEEYRAALGTRLLFAPIPAAVCA